MHRIPGSAYDRVVITHSTADGILTVFVSGPITSELLLQYAEDHLDDWTDQTSILWDMKKAVFINFDVKAYRSIPENFSNIHAVRKTGKTALLASPKEFQLAELVVEHSESHKAPVKHPAFTSKAKAIKWLNSE